jgi:hypothetical protein
MSIDASEYVRRLKLTAIKNGKDVSAESKFRALTRFDSYDPSTLKATGAVCNDVCRSDKKSHNVFTAKKLRADQVPHF